MKGQAMSRPSLILGMFSLLLAVGLCSLKSFTETLPSGDNDFNGDYLGLILLYLLLMFFAVGTSLCAWILGIIELLKERPRWISALGITIATVSQVGMWAWLSQY